MLIASTLKITSIVIHGYIRYKDTEKRVDQNKGTQAGKQGSTPSRGQNKNN